MTELNHADIRWRVGQVSKKDPHKGSLLGYIDARTAMDALDALDPDWSAVHGNPIIVGGELVGVPCSVTVKGVTRSDVGMPSSQEPIKGAYSDALKRAAVHFGVGRELYELPRIWVTLDDYKKPVATPTYKNGRWTLPAGMGSVFYDNEPNEQPGRRGGAKPSSPSAGPVQRTPEEQALLDELIAVPGMSRARMSLLADAVGVEKGAHATADELRGMLALIEQPLSEPNAPAGGEAVPLAASPTTPELDTPATAQGSEEAVPPGASDPASAQTLLDEAVRVAEAPAKGRTTEEAIADAKAKAVA